jgi:hypothetical protein
LPAASFVVTNVIEELPWMPASAPVIAGISFAGEIWAVNVGLLGVDGDVEELLQPTAKRAAATARTNRRVIVRLSFG